ncbi:DUF4743 domain-containing protein [Oceanibaculum pacificum]|uniref:DNA mismatch repair protein MutT n=1 Tax=Oceanibaculum pacificum TaxID=580166 RepID=A0A154WFL0_9PROT|nr:DUF4743 domain-containing protein [Oceanibaculum pacificum]KZD12276.1 DNA mismatch repair protein MutT [Oceanibaculum pacificum]
MSFLDHVTRLNRHDLRGFRPFAIGDAVVGHVRHALAERLKDFSAFQVTGERVLLSPALSEVEARTEAMAEVAETLVADGIVPKIRLEEYPVMARPGGSILMRINRAAVPHFGIIAFGVHLNGYVRRPDGPHLWIGRRSRTKNVAPGKLDNMVAGGMGDGLGPRETLIKECGEEAGMPPALARRAHPAGAITYTMELGPELAGDSRQEGLRRDVLYCYDLEVPADFTPVCQDGELEDFRLMPVAEAMRLVDTTDDFKFNVNLVIIDFLIRHGHLDPDHPDYLALVSGLHR